MRIGEERQKEIQGVIDTNIEARGRKGKKWTRSKAGD